MRFCHFYITPLTNISIPIIISIIPPKIWALFERTVPNFLPMSKPNIQIINVTTAIMSAAAKAIFKSYSAMTKPSDKLYLSYAAMNGEGKSIRPSYLIGTLQQIFPILSVEYPENAPKTEQIYTPQAGMPYLAEALREYALYGSKDVFTLYRA